MKLAIGSDHAGFELKQVLVRLGNDAGHEALSFGATSDEPFDYPDAADEVSKAVLQGNCDYGVLICGTGIGVSIRANRHPGIRAAVCCTVETAKLARKHNHANVLCLGSRTTSKELAEQILLAFSETGESHEDRHERRVRKLDGDVTCSTGVE